MPSGALNTAENRIELYYKAGSIKYFLFWLTCGLLIWVGTLGTFVPFMFFTDESTKSYTELYGYVIFIAVSAWIMAGVIFLYIRKLYHVLKRGQIPIIIDKVGVHNLPSSRKASKTIDMPWENITKIARSASIPGTRRSFHKDRLGTLTAFYTSKHEKPVRCIIDWGLFGMKDMKEKYQHIHVFIANHAAKDCVLESYPNEWPKP